MIFLRRWMNLPLKSLKHEPLKYEPLKHESEKHERWNMSDENRVTETRLTETRLTETLSKALDNAGVTLAEFRELCLRLLNHGVLCRGESQTEQQLYDRYLRIGELVEDYLHILGLSLYHDRRFEYLRVYPPGAAVPGMDDSGEAPFGGLRARLRQDEVALLLVLRLQYDKALREGQLDDQGFVSESLESLGIAMKNLLGRSLPDKVTERKRIFNRLRQLRLIAYRQDEEIDSAEGWLKIHPMIVTFVTDDALAALEETLPERGQKAETDKATEEVGEDYVS